MKGPENMITEENKVAVDSLLRDALPASGDPARRKCPDAAPYLLIMGVFALKRIRSIDGF